MKVVWYLVVLLAFSLHCPAQSVTRCYAPADDPKWIGVALSHEPDAPSATNPSSYYVLDVEARTQLSVEVDASNPSSPVLKLPAGHSLDVSHHYFIVFQGLTFEGKALEQPLIATVNFAKEKAHPTTKIVKAATRDDADIYFAGEVTSVSGGKFLGNIDVLLKVPLFPVFTSAGGKQTLHQVSPFFEMQAASNPEADPDSLNFGVQDDFGFCRDCLGKTTRIYLRNAIKLESTRDFVIQNVIGETRFTFLLPSFRPKSKVSRAYLSPFINSEFGKNISAPFPQIDGKPRVRLGIGAEAAFERDVKSKALREVGLTVSYLRRWPMFDEVAYKFDDNGVLMTTDINSKPKDWLDTKVTFTFDKRFGAYIGYQYGSKPPAFKFVDHKLAIGLTFKAAFLKSSE